MPRHISQALSYFLVAVSAAVAAPPHTSTYINAIAIQCYHSGEIGDSCAPVVRMDFTAEKLKTTGQISGAAPLAHYLFINLDLLQLPTPFGVYTKLQKHGGCVSQKGRHVGYEF